MISMPDMAPQSDGGRGLSAANRAGKRVLLHLLSPVMSSTRPASPARRILLVLNVMTTELRVARNRRPGFEPSQSCNRDTVGSWLGPRAIRSASVSPSTNSTALKAMSVVRAETWRLFDGVAPVVPEPADSNHNQCRDSGDPFSSQFSIGGPGKCSASGIESGANPSRPPTHPGCRRETSSVRLTSDTRN